MICDAESFGKLDSTIRACTAVAYLEDEKPFKKDEAEKIVEFIKKNTIEVARQMINCNSPKAFTEFIRLGKPDKDTLDILLDLVKDKNEIVAILLNEIGKESDATELDDAPKKVKISGVKKEWNYVNSL